MRFFLLSALCAGSLLSAAQTSSYVSWQAKPIIHQIEKKYSEPSAVFVKDETIVEYVFEKEGFFFYKTVHRIVHLNNDKGIENFNKIYLPFDEEYQMVDVKARTISPSGKVIELNKNNIKEIKEEDNTYKIFALEGLEKNSEVEYYYTFKKVPVFFGREMITQRIPAIQSRFELISPDHLRFETKAYNHTPNVKDTTYAEKRHLIIEANDVAESKEEKYSMETASMKRIDYRLSYNKAKNETERLFTWNELAKKVYTIYTTITDKEAKKASDLLKEINIKQGASDKEKIIAIESYLKKNFEARENIPNDDARDIAIVIKNKVGSEMAVGKLFCAVLSAANIDFQLVLSGDRVNYTVDRSFENWNSARNILLYFPSTQKFIAPTESAYRYPWIPPTWGATNGLFCIGTTIGTFTTAIGEVKFIPLEDYEKTYLNMHVIMNVDAQKDSITMTVKQSFAGYASGSYKFPFVFSPKDQERNILKEMIRYGTNSENITSYSFENKELDQQDPYAPFVINTTIKSSDLVEKAGNKILLKVGEIIFQQAEMYDAEKRTTPVELGYAHALTRTIEINLPDNYVVKNLNDLRFNETIKENGEVVAGFVVTYNQEGNKIKIIVSEDYKKVTYPVEEYDSFKKIINTAADFNKVVLVLDKKS